MGSLSLEDALALVAFVRGSERRQIREAAVRWLRKLLREKSMPLALAAQSIELVAQLRGPEAERAAGALEALARP